MDTTVAVFVPTEIVNKLYLAYCGLSPQRQDVVLETMQKRGVSQNQATLEEILTPRIEIYAERGQQAQERKMLELRNLPKELLEQFVASLHVETPVETPAEAK